MACAYKRDDVATDKRFRWNAGDIVPNSRLDPFRVIVGAVAARQNSELLLEMAAATGLRFDPLLVGPDAYSHKTRVRALQPRIIAAYDALDESEALSAANGLTAAIAKNAELLVEVSNALRPIAWDVRDGQLVASEQALREMFFPKGSQWDAFVVLGGVFREAQKELMVVDGYCDQTLFQHLSARAAEPLNVKVLCWRYATAVAAEGRAFAAQYSGWNIEVRQAKDFHDRFVVVDGSSCVHIGASINGAGKTAFMISKVEDQQNRGALLAAIQGSWTAAMMVS
ncbi:hypothetical protein [Paraburkholderia fungorum]|uniref:hypothetical protein n=1 Tax=Paraburkholderia fungorum TaxID=134537 RepID=UPI00248EFE27|nr:hypothetical protein [Paraburkholderia fungorum]